jgi:hypothetical protein
MRSLVLKALVLVPLPVLMLSALSAGCGSSSTAEDQASIRAAWDMVPLAQALVDSGNTGTVSTVVEAMPATDATADLQRGQCNSVILGREPSSQELQGLNDEVIGYDAVTILIDASSANGGEWWVGNMPNHRTTGLKALATAELKGLFSFWITPPGQRWKWTGDYDAWVAHYDDAGQMVGQGWVHQDESVPPPFTFALGKYDTQTALYQALGIDESAVTDTAAQRGLTAVNVDSEEQVLASEYPPGQATGDFIFKIGFSSLRTAKLAIQRLPVSVIAIDGVDPVVAPQSVYDGTYPLTRRIHLLTGANCPESEGLAQFLLSPDGQKVIQDAGYLPLASKN